MSFYSEPLYGTPYYGSDEFNNPSGGVADLNAYQNNLGTVVLYWTLSPCLGTIHSFVWKVETDTDISFLSPNMRVYMTGTNFDGSERVVSISVPLVSNNIISLLVDNSLVTAAFSSNNATTMQALATAISLRPNVASATVVGSDSLSILVQSVNHSSPVVLSGLTITGGPSQPMGTLGAGAPIIYGQPHKGVVVSPYDRLQGASQPMYWRVMGTYGNSSTVYSSSVFNEIPAINGVSRDNELALITPIIYNTTSVSNIYKLHDDFGRSLDDLWVNDAFVNNDTYLELVRDISIQSHFGDLVGIDRPPTMKAIDFREIMREFFVAARQSPMYVAVRNMVRACLVSEPAIVDIRDVQDLYVDDESIQRIVEPPYVTDAFYEETITLSDALVTGNTISITVDGIPFSIPFHTSSNHVLDDMAADIETVPSVAKCDVLIAGGGSNDERVLVIRAANSAIPPVINSAVITGGVSQATITLVSPGYEYIVFDAALLPGNAFTVHVNGVPVTTFFGIDSNTTLSNIADNIAAQPGVTSAHAIYVTGDANDERVILVEVADPSMSPILSSASVYGGQYQSNVTLVSSGVVGPGTMWNNRHLADGIIVNVSNPASAIVSRSFLQGILRKLVQAHAPLYVQGIS